MDRLGMKGAPPKQNKGSRSWGQKPPKASTWQSAGPRNCDKHPCGFLEGPPECDMHPCGDTRAAHGSPWRVSAARVGLR